MFGNDFVAQCRMGCWGLSAGAGLLAVILMSMQGSFIVALLVGLALAIFMALVLIQLFCWDDEDEDGDEDASVTSAPMPTSGAVSNVAQSVVDMAASAAAVVKPSKKLKGEEEIASSKGSWKYGGDSDAGEGATKAPEDLDSKADSSQLFVSESADSEAGAQVSHDYDADGVHEGENEGTRPESLDEPRGGKADNLKEIKGVGPKLETMLNDMGFYHFDQIAGWSPEEVAWVNANLKGFKGRVTRDDWIAQAKILAAGGDTEFSKRVDKGDVY
ncbi:hypothetical protein [Roseovarius aestuariivivens]|uniref:hypothetical protein n=1 Tax=Roseovarius aestuariivivens TaxID=1888910 RepID=UPI00108055B1|nr:hypothetical protein [Roseovarius aestuariivivens]